LYTTLISAADLAVHLADPSVVVVDLRHDLGQPDAWGEAEYRRGHLPGAQFAHLDRDLSAPKSGRNGRHPLPSPDASAAVFGRLGIDATKQVIGYDQGAGTYAARLWWMLRRLGHDAVAVLDGGIDAWKREGFPLTTDVPAAQPTVFTVRQVTPSVDVETVAANLASPSQLLVDARGRERFRGDVEPIDPIPGHIPGAVNRPYTENLRPRRHVQTGRRARRRVRGAHQRPPAPIGRPLLRFGRHCVPQPARDDARRNRRGKALPGIVERVVRRSVAPNRPRR